jgi:hypothetical protein
MSAGQVFARKGLQAGLQPALGVVDDPLRSTVVQDVRLGGVPTEQAKGVRVEAMLIEDTLQAVASHGSCELHHGSNRRSGRQRTRGSAAIRALIPNGTCQASAKARTSSVSRDPTVRHQPRQTTSRSRVSLARSLTTFSTSSRRALRGPKARRHHRAGRLPATPLRCVLGASLGLARTCQQGAESKTAELAINDRHPVDVALAETAAYPPPAVDACSRPPVGSRIAPLAIMEGTARHGTRQGRLRRPSGISDP